ncbi:MAG: hypothetical protein KBD01_17100 [Acidobacteria bacterium]|nr:hypothetical protein [Acidobacteriota bacterium]
MASRQVEVRVVVERKDPEGRTSETQIGQGGSFESLRLTRDALEGRQQDGTMKVIARLGEGGEWRPGDGADPGAILEIRAAQDE